MNNKLKSIYVSVYIVALLVGSLHSAYGLMEFGWRSVWLGLALCLWPNFLFFVRLFLFPVARTTAKLKLLTLTTVLGSLAALMLSKNAYEVSWVYFYGMGIGVSGHLLYVYWYSQLDRQANISLTQGKPLPEFDLKQLDGSSWKSNDLKHHPALLLFFRGNWCPLCMAQVREVAASYQHLSRLGIKVFLISSQPETNTQHLAAKFDLDLTFLIDEQGKAAKALKLSSPHGTPAGLQVLGYDSDTVLPTAILTNKDGAILFADQTDNYRVRPEPETFITIFEQYAQHDKA